METLVRKASLSLFLQEQHNLFTRRIREEIEQNSNLALNLSELIDIDAKLSALNEEIEADENVDLLKEIIIEAKRKQETTGTVTVEFGSPLLNLILELAQILSDNVYRVARLILRSF